MSATLETQQWPWDWKSSIFIPIPKKGNAKECSNYHTIALISHASKVMLKILQARPQQYMNDELADVQAGFRKGRGTRDQIANICWIIGKDSDAGRDWGQEEKGTAEDEMAGWHHWLHGHGSQWTPGVGDGQGGLVCCDSWGHKESDTTERLIWSDACSSPF